MASRARHDAGHVPSSDNSSIQQGSKPGGGDSQLDLALGLLARARELLAYDGAGMVTLDILPDACAVPLLNPALLTGDLAPIYGRGPDATPMAGRLPA
jgi:hypothetical protein